MDVHILHGILIPEVEMNVRREKRCMCYHITFFLFLPDSQFDELEELGFVGFSVAFFQEKSQIVGTSSTLQCFTPQLVEYLHALLITGWFNRGNNYK